MNILDLWKNIERLSVNEFMCLLFGLEPGTIDFDCGNQKDWPKGAVPIYRALTADIVSRKLYVYDDPQLIEFADSRVPHTHEPWWSGGQLYRYQIVKWLAAKGIQSELLLSG